MIDAASIDEILERFEQDPPDMTVFYEALSEEYPDLTAFTAVSDDYLLKDQEHDFLLYLAMIVIRLHDPGFFDLEKAMKAEENLWGIINDTPRWSILEEAEKVAEDDALGELFVDALAPDEENAFLTDEGVQLLWTKLNALAAGFAH